MNYLVIGGSGMLSNAVEEISIHSEKLILMSRDEMKYEASLLNKSNVKFIKYDYIEQQKYCGSLPKINRIIAWVHSPGYESFSGFIEQYASTFEGAELILIKGSSDHDDTVILKCCEKHHIHFKKLRLAHIEVDGQKRWMTNEEISEEVLKFIGLGG